MRLLILLIASLSLSAPVMAQSQSIDIRPKAKRIKGDALLSEFMGVTHKGAYNFSEDGEPGRYFTEVHHEDSRTTYQENENRTPGVWMIMSNQICYQYRSADMSGGCFRVYKVGNCFYYYNGSIPETSSEINRDYWTARTVKKGETANCEPVTT